MLSTPLPASPTIAAKISSATGARLRLGGAASCNWLIRKKSRLLRLRSTNEGMHSSSSESPGCNSMSPMRLLMRWPLRETAITTAL